MTLLGVWMKSHNSRFSRTMVCHLNLLATEAHNSAKTASSRQAAANFYEYRRIFLAVLAISLLKYKF